MRVDNKALTTLRVFVFICVLIVPAVVPAQQEKQNRSPDEDYYGSRFFDQLRSIFGRFREADLQNVFQQAKPVQCSELVGRKGEWREVAFFNENRKLGDWCKESLEEVKGDLSVYTFKGTCNGDQGTVQVATEFPLGDSIEAYNRKRIDFDQIDVNVNDPVTAVFDPRTQALTFELPYLFLTGRQSSGNIYSFIAPNRNSAYATDVTSRWACKTVSSNDVTYRFLICRTATAPRNAGGRNRNWEPAFGASAFFILSDGSEAATSVNVSFGDGNRRVKDVPETTPARPAPGRPVLARTGAAKHTAEWDTADANATVVEAVRDGFRLRFSNQTWSGKIAAPELLSDQKMSSLPQNRPMEGADYCVWNPGEASLASRLLANPPDADVVSFLETAGKSSQSAVSIIFDLKTGAGARVGRLQCYFPRAQSAAEISVDRWVSIVGGHVILEVLR